MGICILFLFHFEPAAADLTIWAEAKPAVVFAREDASVRLFVKNSANSTRKIKLDTRTFQITTATCTAVGERKKWKEISLEAGQTSVEKFQLTLPEIRATANFVLKFYENDNVVEVGSIPLLVYPADLLAEAARFSKTNQLALLEEKVFVRIH